MSKKDDDEPLRAGPLDPGVAPGRSDALAPSPRQSQPRTQPEVAEPAMALKKENPERTATQVRRVLAGPAQTPEETSAFSLDTVSFPSAAASLRLRWTEEKKDQAIRTMPTRPVMTSWISYWMVTSRITARAPIA